MKKECNLNIAVVGAVLVLISIQTALADVTNGDFSEDFTGNTDPTLGWVVTTGSAAGPVDWGGESIDPIVAPAAFFKPDGAAVNSTLSQTITVDPSFTVLSFDIRMVTEWIGIGPPQPETDDFTTSLGGVLLYTLSSSTLVVAEAPSPPDLIDFADTVNLDVSTGTFDLVFNLAHDHTDNWETTVLLDNVRLVPVPGAVVLGSLGLGFTGWRLRKRRLL